MELNADSAAPCQAKDQTATRQFSRSKFSTFTRLFFLLCIFSSLYPVHYLQDSGHQVSCFSLCLLSSDSSAILLSTFPSYLLLTCPYHLSPFSVIFFVADATFTVPLTCSFLVLSFFVTPHIHLSILVSFTSSLLSWPFVLAFTRKT